MQGGKINGGIKKAIIFVMTVGFGADFIVYIFNPLEFAKKKT